MQLRIIIIDDHPVVREGLVAALEPKVDVVGTFASAEEALSSARAHDVVLLDLELPGMSGIDAIPRLRERAAVLVLTAYANDDQIDRALRFGALGYLLKGSPLADIERAIHAVARGEKFIDPRVTARIAAAPRLSAREREVLARVARGRSNKEIATDLGIAERTVKFHVTAIFTKLGAENRAQAVAIASERGLV